MCAFWQRNGSTAELWSRQVECIGLVLLYLLGKRTLLQALKPFYQHKAFILDPGLIVLTTGVLQSQMKQCLTSSGEKKNKGRKKEKALVVTWIQVFKKQDCSCVNDTTWYQCKQCNANKIFVSEKEKKKSNSSTFTG